MKHFIIILLLFISLSVNATKYYISATGSDSNSGLTALLPKQTITAVNALTLNAGDTVAFKKGEGWYGTLTISRSGSSGNPIVYTTYGTGATPTITGFTTITSGWTNEGGGIYSKVISSESQTNEVTIDGVQYGMGRYPNSTFLTYESAVSNTSITDNQLTGTPNWTGAEALIVKNGYRIERCVIASQSTGTLNYTIYNGLNSAANSTGNYFIQNDLRTLDQYGEWYHNTSTGKFYMFFGAVDPSLKVIKVATLNNLIKVTTAKTYISIDGLALTGSIKTAYTAEYNCHNLTVQNCSFQFIGADGVYIDGQNAIVDNTTFNYCNRISVMVKGANATITDNSISNNAILLGQGNYGYSGTSAIVIINDNATVTGNVIQNTATNGIFVDGTVDTGLIKNNYIYNSCLHNWDHGAIYTTMMFVALTIESNIVDISGGAGIYLDAIGGHITVKNNSVTGCTGSGLHVHSQSYDEIFGNTIYNCGTGIFIQNTSGDNDSHDVNMYDNKVVAKASNQKLMMYYSDYSGYAATFSTYSFYNNVYARPIDETSPFYFLGANKTLAQWKTFVGTDTDATGSPKSISSESDIEIRYNATASPVQVSFSWAGINMDGVQYASNPTIPAYSSLVLIKNIPNPSGTKKMWKDSQCRPLGKNGVPYGSVPPN